MNKDLELIKRWFNDKRLERATDWTIDLYNPVINGYDMEIWAPNYECNQTDDNIAQLFKDAKMVFAYPPDCPDMLHVKMMIPIPPQYHTEWEQYVKDKQ